MSGPSTESSVGGGDCSASEFLSEADLREKTALFIPNFVLVDSNGVFDHLTIIQDGNLTKWTFTAEDLGIGRTGYPELRIVRDLQLVPMLSGSTAVSTLYPNVYEVIADPPLPVKTGDFVYLILPSISTARLLLSFVLTGSPPGVSLDTGEDIEGLPLITLEIGLQAAYIPIATYHA